jgi:tetratricopeptide (TPR) repeat protein
MSVFPSPALRALGLTLVFAAAARAQGATKECDVNENRPNQIARATLAVQVATSAQPEVAARQLTSAVRMLTDNGEKMENQPGRNFVLGKALVLWTMQPNAQPIMKRGQLGYATNPEGTIDLIAAIDTAFKVVEASNPDCITETSRWRGQKAWVNLVNKAIEKLNAEEVDSAEMLAQRAITLNPYGPYGYVVLANVMQKRKKASEAFALYRKSYEASARDTAYAEIGRQSLIYLGNLAADSAEMAADAAAKRPYIEAARTAFESVLKDKNAGDLAASARQGLCRVAIATGDTASLRVAYKEPLASPATYSYSDLMSAGVCLARAEMVPEATTLFKAAYEKNPYHRDVLSNLTIMLLRADKFDESLPLAHRLVEVEPNNPENEQLLMLSYAGIAKRARDARLGPRAAATATKGASKTKTGARPATTTAPKLSPAVSDSLFKVEKAYTDSAVTLNARKDSLPVKITLSDFSNSEEKATVAGNVTNQGTAARTITVHVDFLDKTGKVVSTKETTLADVAPGSSKRFTVTVTPGTSITAFRYTAIR